MSAEMQSNFALITAERFLDTDSNTCKDYARLGCRNNFTYINKLSSFLLEVLSLVISFNESWQLPNIN